MEIMEADIPLPLRELLSVMKGDLARYGELQIWGHDYRPVVKNPFYVIYSKSQTSLASVALQETPPSISLTTSYVLDREEKEILRRRLQEFSRKHGYALI